MEEKNQIENKNEIQTENKCELQPEEKVSPAQTKNTIKKFNRKTLGVILCALFLLMVIVVIPFITKRVISTVDITINPEGVNASNYKVKLKNGDTFGDLKAKEIEGYEFLGFYADSKFEILYGDRSELYRGLTVYALYGEKTTLQVITNTQTYTLNTYTNLPLRRVLEKDENMLYVTSGMMYEDEDCSKLIGRTAQIKKDMKVYTKDATLDKLLFKWDSTRFYWTVREKDSSISGDVVIPAKYREGINDWWVTETVEKPNETGAFSGCDNITSVTFPCGFVKIGNGSFSDCDNLKSIIIPKTVRTINYFAFANSCNVNTIFVEEGNENFYSKNNCLVDVKQKAIIKGSNNSAIEIDGEILTVQDYAFTGCNQLETLDLPKTVKYFGICAFKGCEKLTNIKFGQDVETLSEEAFEGCKSLTNITLPKTIIFIGDAIFKGCSSLKEVTFKSKIIANSMFEGCKALETVNVSENLTTIGYNAFQDCSNLKQITIPEKVEFIGANVFIGCEKISINIEEKQGWKQNNGTAIVPIWVEIPADNVETFLKNGIKIEKAEDYKIY